MPIVPPERPTTPTREAPSGARERTTPSRVLGLSPKRERELQLLEVVQRLGCDDTRRTAANEINATLSNLAAEPSERAIVHDLNMILKMLTRQMVDQKGPVVVSTVDLITDAARLHKTEHLAPALPHLVHRSAARLAHQCRLAPARTRR
jgi:hypothetical protein